MNDQALLNALADIEGPTPPDWQPVITGTLIIAALLIGAIIWLLRKQKNTPPPAPDKRNRDSHPISLATINQRIDQLHKSWAQGQLDDRETSYQLAALIRHGLQLNQYSQATNSRINLNEWQPILQTMTALRYQPQSTVALNQTTFATIKTWLNHSASQTTAIDHA